MNFHKLFALFLCVCTVPLGMAPQSTLLADGPSVPPPPPQDSLLVANGRSSVPTAGSLVLPAI